MRARIGHVFKYGHTEAPVDRLLDEWQSFQIANYMNIVVSHAVTAHNMVPVLGRSTTQVDEQLLCGVKTCDKVANHWTNSDW